MVNKKEDRKKNSFFVRIYDDDLLTSIIELNNTGQFSSTNELLTQALAIGIEKIYLTFGKKKSLSTSIEPTVPTTQKIDELLYRVENMELTSNDLFVMMSVLEVMITTLYNVEAAKSDGEAVSAELMDSGYYSALPVRYQEIKDKLIKRIERKYNREKSQNAKGNF